MSEPRTGATLLSFHPKHPEVHRPGPEQESVIVAVIEPRQGWSVHEQFLTEDQALAFAESLLNCIRIVRKVNRERRERGDQVPEVKE